MSNSAYNCKVAAYCWIAMLFVLIAGTFAIRLEPVARLDREILERLAAGRTVELDRIFTYVSWAGSSFLLLPLLFVIAFIISMRNHVQEGIFQVSSFFGISALNNLFKHVIARPRPNLFPAVIDMPGGFSFPSAHSVQITAFVLSLLIVLKAPARARWFSLSMAVGALLVSLVCLSRLYLQVHYPTDVAAGLLTGIFWVFGLAALMLPDDQARPDPLRGLRIGKGRQP
jgi:membrane-associated phospholipid phosphatase